MGRSPLVVERMAEVTGFAALARRLDRPGWGPYLLFGTVLFFDLGVLSGIQYLQWGYYPILANPGVLAVPLGIAFVLRSLLGLRDRYNDTTANLTGKDDGVAVDWQHDLFVDRLLGYWDRSVAWATPGEDLPPPDEWEIVPRRVTWLFVLGGIGYHWAWILFSPGAMTFIVQTEGPVIGRIKFFVLLPFVYYPLFAEFVAVIVGIHAFLPSKARIAGTIDFSDPLNYAGLRPLGRFLEASALRYFMGLLLYVLLLVTTIWAETRGGTDFPEIGTLQTLFILTATVFGLLLFFGPVYSLHRYVAKQKELEMQRIAEAVNQTGPDDAMFPYTAVSEADDAQEYTHHFINMTKVNETKEFPVSVGHLVEFFFVAALPYLTSVTTPVVLDYLR